MMGLGTRGDQVDEHDPTDVDDPDALEQLTDDSLEDSARWTKAILKRQQEIAAGVGVSRNSGAEVQAARLLGKYGHRPPKGATKAAPASRTIVVVEVPAGQAASVKVAEDGRIIAPEGSRVLELDGSDQAAAALRMLGAAGTQGRIVSTKAEPDDVTDDLDEV